MEFDWDDANIGHIARHRVEPAEVEQIFMGEQFLSIDAYERNGELRYAIAGVTSKGRVLFIVYTRKEEMIRVATAHESRKYRRFFGEEGTKDGQ